MLNKNWLLHEIGKRIRQLREATGYSQEAFALFVGLDRSYYGSIERGERNITATNIYKIAKALNVEVSEIFPSIDQFLHL